MEYRDRGIMPRSALYSIVGILPQFFKLYACLRPALSAEVPRLACRVVLSYGPLEGGNGSLPKLSFDRIVPSVRWTINSEPRFIAIRLPI